MPNDRESVGPTSDAFALAGERFREDASGHVMTILADTPNLRHLRFANPTNSEYWFEVVSWPGVLVYTGDMGDYIFRWWGEKGHVLNFFTNPSPHYLAEKVTAGEIREYSRTIAERLVRAELAEMAQDVYTSPATLHAINDGSLLEEVFESAYSEQAVRENIDTIRQLHGESAFQDWFEVDLTDLTPQFAWSLHALSFAARTWFSWSGPEARRSDQSDSGSTRASDTGLGTEP